MKSNFVILTLVIFGSTIALFARAGEGQYVYLLILGILILMFGLYRLSSRIPDKQNGRGQRDKELEEE